MARPRTDTGHALSHQTSDLELDDPLRRDLDLLERARVLRSTRRALLGLEHSELTEFQAVAVGEFGDDRIQERLDDVLADDLGDPGRLGDAIDEFCS